MRPYIQLAEFFEKFRLWQDSRDSLIYPYITNSRLNRARRWNAHAAFSFPRALPSRAVFAWLLYLEFAKRSDYLKVIASTRKFASEEEARFKV